MNIKQLSGFTTILSLTLTIASQAAPATNRKGTDLKELLEQNLTFMKSVYEATYAPKEWKKKYANWELNQVFAEARNSVTALDTNGESINAQAVRDLVKKFIYSTQDYHVSVRFFATEAASLPFTVKSAEGKVFLANIDRTKLPAASFPFNVGDEVIAFAGKPVKEAIAEVQNQLTANIAETDLAQADIKLTSRKASSGYRVPSGTVLVTFKPKGSEQVQSIELRWDYTPEKLNPFSGLTQKPASAVELKSKKRSAEIISELANFQMIANGAQDDLAKSSTAKIENPFLLGEKKSYIPLLGQKIWQSDDTNTYDAYIYKSDDRKLIGVIRIPTYSLAKPEDYVKAVADFSKIITLFQASTDSMVIDQINNPGGSVFYLYALASMLADQPLQAPKHRMTMTQSDINSAIVALEELTKVTDDESAKKILGETMSGFPVSYQVAQFTKGYYEFLISEWNKGKVITDPYYIGGANQLNPNTTAKYTKPILLVVNELCYSGGDFFPAIMQDNKRATVLGVRTAGAGGYVRDVTYPNALGIQAFRVTASIAERVNLNPIENLGVKPDVDYKLTASDFQNGFAGYKAAIKSAVESLAK